MVGVQHKSSRRINDMAIKYPVDEDTELSVALEDEEKHRSLRLADAIASTRASAGSDFPTFDSSFFGTQSLNTHTETKNDSDFEMAVDFDGSYRGRLVHASKLSTRSLDISSSYGDEVPAGNPTKRRWTVEKGQLLLKCLIFTLLIVAGILSLFTVRNYNATTCGFANLILSMAIAVVFVVYDFRLRRQHAKLIKSVTRSEAIVNSLFPEIVRDRILEEGDFASSKFAPSARSSSGDIAPLGDKIHPDTTATPTSKFREDTKSSNNDSSFNSFSSQFSDDPIELSPKTRPKEKFILGPSPKQKLKEKFVPPPPTPKSTSPKFSRRKSNQSTLSEANTIISEAISESNHFRSNFGNNSSHPSPYSSKPIADYFPSATIMFADIVGFTSWASIREPAQVFELLETLYGRFDRIAKKKGVFKVETIGDCYVAATGLPNAMNNHAVAMASFARRCLESMLETVAELEESLGPGTADLGIRVGIHSGSVIGGVLRGAKSRYQLFGDTMNTASRIESTSAKNKIQLSQDTAELIIEAGKKPWVEERRDTIFAKGKGELKTYWLSTEGPKNLSAKEKQALPALLKMMAKANIDPGFIKKKKTLDRKEKRERYVDYHTNVLTGLLKKLVAMHSARRGDCSEADAYAEMVGKPIDPYGDASTTKTFAEEAVEGILFPTSTQPIGEDDEEDPIEDSVSNQLRELISKVSRWHRDDLPFHSFEHASHTVLSITKLLAAVETTCASNDTVLNKTKSMITHPLTQFVLVFAALVPNDDSGGNDAVRGLIAAEKSALRAWSLFLEPSFRDLRRTIFRTRQDFEFFRRLLGKSIVVFTMETADSISDEGDLTPSGLLSMERVSSFAKNQEASQKALAIVEKLLRVSGVSYALQHFLFFQKWNRLLFLESHGRFKNNDGTVKEDPSETWYATELQSFDDRINLVRGLRDSGVCNKLADVYLNAGIANRREWEQKGKPIIEQYLSNQGEKQSSLHRRY
eukprot:CAMPEP_0116121830 /NCGR_PEP_ID=MMETSP0329-20121206/3901_1 /TAXON_ID=697910 /ORGANISM="Pseudo-nitzschia arenysensis, Strain B593" /LENGTH=980 /DNA_ID=CAMNT_0003615659 /DNA_START=123 /DNA_END=3065 /DNA_ORIENTATION=+